MIKDLIVIAKNLDAQGFKKISNDPRISNIAIAMNKALQNPSIKTNFIATVKTAVQNKA